MIKMIKAGPSKTRRELFFRLSGENRRLISLIKNKKRKTNCLKVFAILMATLYMGFVICCPLTFDFFIEKDLKQSENSESVSASNSK